MGSKRAFYSRKFEQNQTTDGRDMKPGPLGTVLTIFLWRLSATFGDAYRRPKNDASRKNDAVKRK